MPLPEGTTYRVITKGKNKIRLAYDKSGKVIEAKNLDTGATHTPEEFEEDAEKQTDSPDNVKEEDMETHMNSMIRGKRRGK